MPSLFCQDTSYQNFGQVKVYLTNQITVILLVPVSQFLDEFLSKPISFNLDLLVKICIMLN